MNMLYRNGILLNCIYNGYLRTNSVDFLEVLILHRVTKGTSYILEQKFFDKIFSHSEKKRICKKRIFQVIIWKKCYFFISQLLLNFV